MNANLNRTSPFGLEPVEPWELTAVEGGIGAFVILAGAAVLLGVTVIGGAYAAGTVVGGTSDDCKK